MEQLDRDRRTARRRMAWASFVFLLLVSTLVVSSLVLSPARLEIATAFATGSAALVGTFTVFSSIVLSYLGVSLVERLMRKE